MGKTDEKLDTNKANKEMDKKKVKRRIIQLGALVFIIVLMILLLVKCSSDADKSNIEYGVIDIPDGYKVQEMVNNKTDLAMFQVFINTHITVDNEGNANVLIQNSKDNNYSAFVDIYNKEEKIYETDVLEPGYKIEKDTIKGLSEGKYDCVAYFHIMQDGKEINKISVNTTIIREK